MASTAITPFEPSSMEQALALAERLSKSGLLPQALRGKPDDILVVLITGHELGLSPMQAVRGLHVVQGRAVMSADLMVALVTRRTDTCEYFRLVESTPAKAVYETKRKGHPQPTSISYTIEEAKSAGLTGKDNWKNYPAAMLRARCSSALVRAVYPDLMLGVYESDEIVSPAPKGSAAAEAIIDAVFEQQQELAPPSAPNATAEKSPTAPAASGEQEAATDVLQYDLICSVLEGATTIDEITALLPAIKDLPESQRDLIRPRYSAKKAELAKSAAVQS